MHKKNLLVFDIDGTLTDTVKLHQKAFTKMLFEIGIKRLTSEFKSFKHHTDSFIAKEIYETATGKSFSKSKLLEFENGLTKKISSEEIIEIKGAKNLIDTLEINSDFGVCYATGSLRRPAEYKLNSIGIAFKENLLVASDEIYEREGIVEKAIQNAAAHYQIEKFKRIISVGDGLWDLLTARNLGLEFIGIGLQNRNILKENGAENIYENLEGFELI